MDPKSVTKIRTRKGKSYVEFIDSVDHVNYTMNELINAALKDVGRYIVKVTKSKIKKKTGNLAKNTAYKVLKKKCCLKIGFKPKGFYGGFQELGTERIRKVGALSSTVEENIEIIKQIEAQYLTALNSETMAASLIGKDDGSSEK